MLRKAASPRVATSEVLTRRAASASGALKKTRRGRSMLDVTLAPRSDRKEKGSASKVRLAHGLEKSGRADIVVASRRHPEQRLRGLEGTLSRRLVELRCWARDVWSGVCSNLLEDVKVVGGKGREEEENAEVETEAGPQQGLSLSMMRSPSRHEGTPQRLRKRPTLRGAAFVETMGTPADVLGDTLKKRQQCRLEHPRKAHSPNAPGDVCMELLKQDVDILPEGHLRPHSIGMARLRKKSDALSSNSRGGTEELIDLTLWERKSRKFIDVDVRHMRRDVSDVEELEPSDDEISTEDIGPQLGEALDSVGAEFSEEEQGTMSRGVRSDLEELSIDGTPSGVKCRLEVELDVDQSAANRPHQHRVHHRKVEHQRSLSLSSTHLAMKYFRTILGVKGKRKANLLAARPSPELKPQTMGTQPTQKKRVTARSDVIRYIPPGARQRQLQEDDSRLRGLEDLASGSGQYQALALVTPPPEATPAHKPKVPNMRFLARKMASLLETDRVCCFNPLQVDEGVHLSDDWLCANSVVDRPVCRQLVRQCSDTLGLGPGVKALPLVCGGRYQFEVELLAESSLVVGWSAATSLPFNFDFQSFGYSSGGCLVNNHYRFEGEPYGPAFGRAGDVVGALLDGSSLGGLQVSFMLNGRSLGVAFDLTPPDDDDDGESGDRRPPLQPHLSLAAPGHSFSVRFRGGGSASPPVLFPAAGFKALGDHLPEHFFAFDVAVAKATELCAVRTPFLARRLIHGHLDVHLPLAHLAQERSLEGPRRQRSQG